MALISQSEFAALHDVSRAAVTGWKNRGWLVLEGDQVDVEASNAQIEKYRRKVVKQPASVNKSVKKVNKSELTVKQGESAEQAAVRILVSNGADMDMDEARRVKENYLALLNQLEYDQKSGLVVAVSEVTKAVAEEYAKVRTRLLAIPAEQAPRIHRLKTVTEIQDALLELITDALEELTRDGAGD